MSKEIQDFVCDFALTQLPNLTELEEYAKNNYVPICSKPLAGFLHFMVATLKPKNILEIGTAIGYSSIMMALSGPDITITTIEKDKDRYIEALKNIKKLQLEDRITLVFNDALEVKLNEKFDLIIIDAAKSKNLEFFEHFERNLDTNGSIITENLSFHGYVEKDLKEIESRNIRGLVKKIRNYKDFLENNIKYITKFYDIGDGISVTERRIG